MNQQRSKELLRQLLEEHKQMKALQEEMEGQYNSADIHGLVCETQLKHWREILNTYTECVQGLEVRIKRLNSQMNDRVGVADGQTLSAQSRDKMRIENAK